MILVVIWAVYNYVRRHVDKRGRARFVSESNDMFVSKSFRVMNANLTKRASPPPKKKKTAVVCFLIEAF